MSSVTCHISISLDGFVAGPNQSVENPIGEGGMRLHQWVFETASWRERQGLGGGEHSADIPHALVRNLRRGAVLSALGSLAFAPAGGFEHPLVETHPPLADGVLNALV